MSETAAGVQPVSTVGTRKYRFGVRPMAVLSLAVVLAAPLTLVAVEGYANAPQPGTQALAAIDSQLQPQEFAVASELTGVEASERSLLSATSATELADQKVEAERLERIASATNGQVASASLSSMGASGSQIADLALQYTGVPYIFGGATPGGWDCSGFTKWVVQQVTGVTLPHGTNSQADLMTWIPASEAQPGDFWFRSNYDGSPGYGHVGIYLGNGMIVHSPQEGEYTRVQSIYASGDFYRF